jgi:hypothetical protein
MSLLRVSSFDETLVPRLRCSQHIHINREGHSQPSGSSRGRVFPLVICYTVHTSELCDIRELEVEDNLYSTSTVRDDRDEACLGDYFLPAFLAAVRARVICFFQP